MGLELNAQKHVKQNEPISHKKNYLTAFSAMILLPLALLGNYFAYHLFFGVDFIFGSIFVMTSLMLLDSPITLLITVVSSSLTALFVGASLCND